MTTLSAETIRAGTSNAASVWAQLWAALKTICSKVHVKKKTRALHLQETLGLGDRRFIAVVDWDGKELLVGVTPQSIALLEPRSAASGKGKSTTPKEEHSA
jgi:flagellar biogenesis protein FliO